VKRSIGRRGGRTQESAHQDNQEREASQTQQDREIMAPDDLGCLVAESAAKVTLSVRAFPFGR
jgi:hypothetical protein